MILELGWCSCCAKAVKKESIKKIDCFYKLSNGSRIALKVLICADCRAKHKLNEEG